MEHIILNLLQNFEEGKISRRQLVGNLLAAASAASVVGSVPVQAAEPSLKSTKIQHISYTVPDYTKARDFYSGVVGMKVSADTGMECHLTLGDVFLVARNISSVKKTRGVDHIAYAIDSTRSEIEAYVKRRGFESRGGFVHNEGVHINDPYGLGAQLDPMR